MSISIKIIQRTDKLNRNQTAPIHLRITHRSKSRYISTSVTLPMNAWNAQTQQINPDYPSARELQLKIDSIRIKYEKKIKRLEALDIPVNFDTLFEVKGRKACITIEDGFKAEIERLEALGKYNSAAKHKSALIALNTYKPTKMALEAIDLDYLKGFELYLRKRDNKDNSIATRFAIFKAIYNKAVKEGKIVVKQNPFTLYQVGGLWTKTRKRAICKEDIQRLINLDIPYNYRSNYKRLAKDLFLFSYFTAGMNFNDIARLRNKDIINGRVCYSRHKTQKLLSCKLSEQAQAIVKRYSKPDHDPEDYIFPIFDRQVHTTEQQKFNRIVKSLRKVNSALKEIGKEIGLQFPLTTYVARHTFATVLKRSGVSVALISESLGHSDLSTTQIYLDSFENEQIDQAMRNLL